MSAFGRVCGAAVALCAVLSTAAAAQQQQDYIGLWACQASYEIYDKAGNRTQGHNREYMLGIYANGQFEAQGTVLSAAGYNQIRSQGQWTLENGNIVASGPEVSDALNVPGMTFVHLAQVQGGNVMIFSLKQPDPTQSYVANRSDIYCERRQ